MKRAVVTGAAGMIGTALIKHLVNTGVEVIAFVNPSSETPKALAACGDAVTILPLGLDEYDDFVQALGAQNLPRCDVLYHFAWAGTIGEGRNDEELQAANVSTTLDAVRLACAFGCKTFIGAGSQAEYGHLEGSFGPETPTNPVTQYGKAKLEAGKKSRELAHALGLKHIWTRIGSVYGPGDSSKTVISQAMQHALDNEPLACTAGEQMWDHIYCDDAARAFALLAEHGVDGRVYPIGTGKTEPLREHIDAACKVVNPGFEPDFGAVAYPDGQVMLLQADISQLQQDTGFEPQVSFAEGIAKTAEWFLSERAGASEPAAATAPVASGSAITAQDSASASSSSPNHAQRDDSPISPQPQGAASGAPTSAPQRTWVADPPQSGDFASASSCSPYRAQRDDAATGPAAARKLISIMIPCYNEEDNVIPISQAVIDVMERELPTYDYEIVFIDNCSKDLTRPRLRQLCANNPNIKAIFNVKNFGQFNSPYYGLTQTNGDCAICLCADFQDPVELIPRFVAEWENGAQIVSGIKTSSREGKIMYLLRTMYYKLIHKVSDVEQIQHFTGFGLYDRSFLDVMRDLHDPTPFLRGIVAELGGKRVDVEYEQAERRAGKTHNNWYTLYDAAMLSFTSYTKVPLRIASIGGFLLSVLFFIIAIVLFIVKIVNWNAFAGGQTSILMAVLFIGSILMFFLGLLGEYVMAMSQRVMDRPLVVEQERLNFTEEADS